jgi:hypothetical protein
MTRRIEHGNIHPHRRILASFGSPSAPPTTEIVRGFAVQDIEKCFVYLLGRWQSIARFDNYLPERFNNDFYVSRDLPGIATKGFAQGYVIDLIP